MSTLSDFGWPATHSGVQNFEYPAAGMGWADTSHLPDRREPQRVEAQLAEARREGAREGELRARAVFEESLQTLRAEIGEALSRFEQERKGYFRRVEAEVVQLSLAIARKVIHREAQIDKQLLAGIVRALIAELSDSTGIVLRVHPSAEQEWSTFAASVKLEPKPKIVGDPAIERDACWIVTQLGTTQISLDGQLKAVEEGLLDLLAHRPEAQAV